MARRALTRHTELGAPEAGQVHAEPAAGTLVPWLAAAPAG
jgi:hypothetical protein